MGKQIVDSKRILYVGDLWYGSTALWRRDALCQLGFIVDSVDTSLRSNWLLVKLVNIFHKLGFGLDLVGANNKIRRLIETNAYDYLWIDKGITIRPGTLRRVKTNCPITTLVSYSPDDMFNPKNQTNNYLRSIRVYEQIITTKSFNVAEFKALGAQNVHFVSNSYDPKIHRPMKLEQRELIELAADVGFIGNFEEPRLNSILFLVKNGVPVNVKGKQWVEWRNSFSQLKVDPFFYSGVDYAKAISATKINLGFLFKGNRDLQTQRSIEIPACGGFLLAERTTEHLSLFKEGEEAEFFDNDEELLSKVIFYLKNENARSKIATAGYHRCVASRYDYLSVLQDCIKKFS